MNERADPDREDEDADATPATDQDADATPADGTGSVEEPSGPSIPSVDVPEAPEPAQSDESTDEDESVPTGVKVIFWRLVFLYKFAVLGLTLGLLLLAFDRGPDLGLELTVLGLLLLGVALYRTRRGKRRLDAGEFETDADEGDSEPHREDGTSETQGDDESSETREDDGAGEPVSPDRGEDR